MLRWNFVLVAVVLYTVAAAGQDEDAASALRQQYVGKMVKLNVPADGERLVFSADGTLTAGEPGPWSTAGHVTIRSLSIKENTAFVEAERAFLVYDNKEKRYRDFFEVVGSDELRSHAGLRGINKKDREWFEKQRPVSIAVSFQLDPRVALEKVFALDEDLNWPPAPKNPGKPAHSGVGRGVSAPRVTWSPNPGYSKFAERAHLQGASILWVVIGPDGQVKDIKVQRPLGLGLDEKAVEAVRQWKFKPAEKDGQPVAVQVNVEINFRLY